MRKGGREGTWGSLAIVEYFIGRGLYRLLAAYIEKRLTCHMEGKVFGV